MYVKLFEEFINEEFPLHPKQTDAIKHMEKIVSPGSLKILLDTAEITSTSKKGSFNPEIIDDSFIDDSYYDYVAATVIPEPYKDSDNGAYGMLILIYNHGDIQFVNGGKMYGTPHNYSKIRKSDYQNFVNFAKSGKTTGRSKPKRRVNQKLGWAAAGQDF